MFWRSKKRPDATDEGQWVGSLEKAKEICSWHNKHYPACHHWYEEDNG